MNFLSFLEHKHPGQNQNNAVSVVLVCDAAEEYAEQTAKDYAAWLNHQVAAGRTSTKFWNDYQTDRFEHLGSEYDDLQAKLDEDGSLSHHDQERYEYLDFIITR